MDRTGLNSMETGNVTRVLLLTDSLGCPRSETHVSQTWTDRILRKRSSNNLVFYTKCTHGLAARDINVEDIKELEPDIVFCQIGIVDACRGALTRVELRVLSKIPIVRNVIHWVCSKYHYQITKVRNIHETSPRKFQDILQNMIVSCPKTAFYFIAIARPGKFMVKKTYHVNEDVREYNTILKTLKNSNGAFIDPFIGYDDPNAYVISADGHHLNETGLNLVFDSVNDTIEKFISKAQRSEEQPSAPQ